jgi:hypothetical protein
LLFMAAFWHTLMAKAVFPMEGLAAIRIKSDF